MQRKEVLAYYNQLEKFIKLLKLLMVIMIATSFLLYGLAAFVLLKGYGLAAFFIATISYLIFTMIRRNVLDIAKLIFGVDESSSEFLDFIEKDQGERPNKEYMDLLYKAKEVVHDQGT